MRGTDSLAHDFQRYLKGLTYDGEVVGSIDELTFITGISPFDPSGGPRSWYVDKLPVLADSLVHPEDLPDLSDFWALRGQYLSLFDRVMAEHDLPSRFRRPTGRSPTCSATPPTPRCRSRCHPSMVDPSRRRRPPRRARPPLVVTTDEVSICSPFPPHQPDVGRAGAHFVGLNVRRPPFDFHGRPATEVRAEHWERWRPYLHERVGLPLEGASAAPTPTEPA
ncbi:hypothetical protein WMF31_05765 [Sorangium sp. So ce1036]|uniref:hypothetical protein n=1 Tax=Sorangium sp. So ce1036 TaxID=3133328 RepID=UPI003F03F185